MTKKEAYENYDAEVEKYEAKCNCQDYFFAGWDACEELWLSDNPDKDLMISELEEENSKLKQVSYEKSYFTERERCSKLLSCVAQFSTILGSSDTDVDKIKRLEKALNGLRAKGI